MTDVAPAEGVPRVSEPLDRFSRETFDRPAILRFVASAARDLPPGSRVLDAGAGSAPYRELFAHCEYTTVDWENSAHAGAAEVDVVAALDALPFEAASFDAVLNTQVLEHVEHPPAVLAEFHRVLAPGRTLVMTAPMVWPLHEEPYDYFRFTEHGLRSLLAEAGFVQISVEPHGGYFATIAQLLRGFGSTVPADGSRRLGTRIAASAMWRLAPAVAKLDRFDRSRRLALGYACRAQRAND